MARKPRVQYPGGHFEQLAARRKDDREKAKIARRLREETTMALEWIAGRLNMGAVGYAPVACAKPDEEKMRMCGTPLRNY